MNSITSNATKNTLEVGTNLEYGKTHQFGDPNHKYTTEDGKELDAPIPQRKFLGFRGPDPTNIKRILVENIKKQFGVR
jgi:phage gpG-like protein